MAIFISYIYIMNALFSAIINKKKIILANEGRLLKKSFFGLLILSLTFQSGNFGQIVRQAMIDGRDDIIQNDFDYSWEEDEYYQAPLKVEEKKE